MFAAAAEDPAAREPAAIVSCSVTVRLIELHGNSGRSHAMLEADNRLDPSKCI